MSRLAVRSLGRLGYQRTGDHAGTELRRPRAEWNDRGQKVVAGSDVSTAIEVDGLTKQYRGVLAVDHLSLSVESGEIFGFLGPNGAGKSTTMRMLLGLVRPTSGRARMLGMDVQSQLKAILARTGSLIENPTFYPYLSGRDNLRAFAAITGTATSRVPDLLALVDLSGAAGRKFRTYSLGMKQRLAVAAALLNNPAILILDEPANGLDPAGIVQMRTLMKRLKAEGRTIFISSHVLHEIEQICDRVAILDRGRIVAQGRVDDLLSARNRIEIRVHETERARQIVQGIDWVHEVQQEGDRLLVTAPLDRSTDINRALAQHGLYAAEIRPREESLEHYFLGVTERDAS